MSPITLTLELVLAAMLAACLFYFWRLDRKLAALRNGQDGVRAAAAELAQATAQAEAAVRAMRLTATIQFALEHEDLAADALRYMRKALEQAV